MTRLLYFAPVPWNSYEQRPHYVVRHFLEQAGRQAWWIDPYPARLPRIDDVRRARASDPPLEPKRPPGLSVVRVPGWPIDPMPGGTRVNTWLHWRPHLRRFAEFGSGRDAVVGIGRPTALALAALGVVRPAWTFYDAMDDFPEFYDGASRQSTAELEREIVGSVDRLWAASPALVRRYEAEGRRVTFLRNGLNMAELGPVDAAPAADAVPGFIGCMGRWFDWDLVGRLAASIAPTRVVLVGPRQSTPRTPLPANVECRPPVLHQDAANLLRGFSVGLMPALNTPLTSVMDPIKYYLYRAAGLPVLSSRFGEMSERAEEDGVFVLNDAADRLDDAALSAVMNAALSWRPDPDEVRRFRAEHDWSARFARLRLFDEKD